MFNLGARTRTGLATTSALWSAVGGHPLDEVLRTMKHEGWIEESSSEGTLRTIGMVRESKHATLYISNNKVGMVRVQ